MAQLLETKINGDLKVTGNINLTNTSDGYFYTTQGQNTYAHGHQLTAVKSSNSTLTKDTWTSACDLTLPIGIWICVGTVRVTNTTSNCYIQASISSSTGTKPKHACWSVRSTTGDRNTFKFFEIIDCSSASETVYLNVRTSQASTTLVGGGTVNITGIHAVKIG